MASAVTALVGWTMGVVGGGGAAVALAQDPTADGQPFDREYVLEAWILGYRGVGGEIDGVRNPVLQARVGEKVRITIVGVEQLPHDIALEKAGIESAEVTDVGERVSITFNAEADDIYYCTIPGHRAAGMEGRFEIIDEERVSMAGVEVRKNGRPMNLGFDAGTLEDWKADGDAFPERPLQRAGEAGAAGDFWITSGAAGYKATGTLTSEPFEVTHPYAAFRVAGGALKDTRVELVRADGDSVVFEISGYGAETLRPVVADLRPHVGKQLYVRLIDRETGESGLPYIKDNELAYISFDDFRLYESRPSFTNELTAAEIKILPPLDVVKYGGLSASDAAAAMDLPDGFTVTAAASEPAVVRPIAFTMDERGRLWVAEGHTYPVRAPEGEGRDRILILEDSDGDGVLDSRKVFTEGLNLVSGLEVGFGGVWVGAAPYLLFIPIDSASDRPAGPPRVMLDGFGYQDTHETLNSFRWGPDGWLYGTHGVFTHSKVGKPGTPQGERVGLNAGVWRYHPTRHVFERFAEGTSNPWGIDFDDYGQAFITACVIPHLFHVIPGAHYHRQSGEHFNPFVFEDIKTHADHVHWVGEYGPHAGNMRSAAVGGGHAHAGAMIYLGGSWPAEYRNRIFMNNIHGARTNTDILERRGSGYVGHHGPDFLVTNDSWSQMLSMRYGPDGSVHFIDWYDKNQCHSRNPDVHEKTLGRIYKVSHRNDRWVKVDLNELSSAELVELQLHPNDWYVRNARRLLQERGPDAAVHRSLNRILSSNPDVTRRLRALWALHVTEGISERELTELLADESEYMRAWALQLLAEDYEVPADALARMATMAKTDGSQLVRLHLAAALQRVPADQRWPVLEGLASHAGDNDDHNLPLMVWYAAEPTAEADLDRALDLALASEIETLLPFTVHRVSAMDDVDTAMRALATRLAGARTERQKRELMEGLNRLLTPEDVADEVKGH